jgi:hypothetical protein
LKNAIWRRVWYPVSQKKPVQSDRELENKTFDDKETISASFHEFNDHDKLLKFRNWPFFVHLPVLFLPK